MPKITTIFDEVYITAQKSGKCIACGKQRRRSRKFWQTLNPFNKTTEGKVKTASDIMPELREQIKAWQTEPINCCA